MGMDDKRGRLLVDEPMWCNPCGIVWYLTTDFVLMELERNGEVIGGIYQDVVRCPLCGAQLEWYDDLTE